MRFSKDDVRTLIEMRWWDWLIHAVTTHPRVITDGLVAASFDVAASLDR